MEISSFLIPGLPLPLTRSNIFLYKTTHIKWAYNFHRIVSKSHISASHYLEIHFFFPSRNVLFMFFNQIYFSFFSHSRSTTTTTMMIKNKIKMQNIVYTQILYPQKKDSDTYECQISKNLIHFLFLCSFFSFCVISTFHP